jgi:modulator of drug activity B
MKNVLIINGHQKYEGIAEGKLTKIVIDNIKNELSDSEFTIEETYIEEAYEVSSEVEKFKKADYIIFQYPVYWMSVPWIAKKYIDEVFSAGAGTVTYENDGRSRSDASKKYGSGGLMTDKKYMLSLTYNCPETEFDNVNGFFDGLSLDEANYAIHKIFQFCGATQMKSYAMHDIFKSDLDINLELNKLNDILKENFKG